MTEELTPEQEEILITHVVEKVRDGDWKKFLFAMAVVAAVGGWFVQAIDANSKDIKDLEKTAQTTAEEVERRGKLVEAIPQIQQDMAVMKAETSHIKEEIEEMNVYLKRKLGD